MASASVEPDRFARWAFEMSAISSDNDICLMLDDTPTAAFGPQAFGQRHGFLPIFSSPPIAPRDAVV